MECVASDKISSWVFWDGGQKKHFSFCLCLLDYSLLKYCLWEAQATQRSHVWALQVAPPVELPAASLVREASQTISLIRVFRWLQLHPRPGPRTKWIFWATCTNNIKRFKTAAARHWTKREALLNKGPCMTTQVTCQKACPGHSRLPATIWKAHKSELLSWAGSTYSTMRHVDTLLSQFTKPWGGLLCSNRKSENFRKTAQLTLTRKMLKPASLSKDPLLKYTQEVNFIQKIKNKKIHKSQIQN